MEELAVPGAFVYTPDVHSDDRGEFLEWFRGNRFGESLGHRLSLAQANMSVSRQGVLRGIHFADVPPGQAKYVTCARGAILDVVIDIRVGSPTFGRWDGVTLDDSGRRAIYISAGLGHAFCALTDDATAVYLCSEPYNAQREHTVNPLDPEIGIDWPKDVAPVLSPKDAAAPSLADALRAGILPAYDDCVKYAASLRH